MRVKLSSLYAGPRGSWGPGLCDIPADIGNELIEAGVAILVNVEARDMAIVDEELAPEEEAPARRGPRRSQAAKPEE